MNVELNLESLEILDALERRGTYAKAAEELNKASSTLSQHMAALEEGLGATLLTRTERVSVLTPAGKLALKEGWKIMAALERLALSVRELSSGWEPKISIGVESTIDYPQFFNVLTRFSDAHPLIEIDLSEVVLNGGWEALEHDDLDLIVGVPGPAPSQKGFRAEKMTHNDMVMVASTKYRYLLKLDDDDLSSELDKVRKIILHDTSGTGIQRGEGLSSGASPIYVQNSEQKFLAVLSGAGIAHIPMSRCWAHLDSGELIKVGSKKIMDHDEFLAYKISSKGNGLREIVIMLLDVEW